MIMWLTFEMRLSLRYSFISVILHCGFVVEIFFLYCNSVIVSNCPSNGTYVNTISHMLFCARSIVGSMTRYLWGL